MKFLKLKKLKGLLELSSSKELSIQNCKILLSNSEIRKYEFVGKVTLESTQEIYNRRYDLMLSQNNHIEGFKELVSELKLVSEAYLLIHDVLFEEKKFIIFTNLNLSKIIGVLELKNNYSFD